MRLLIKDDAAHGSCYSPEQVVAEKTTWFTPPPVLDAMMIIIMTVRRYAAGADRSRPPVVARDGR